MHFHFVKDSLGQELLEVVPDEHGDVLRGAEGGTAAGSELAEMAEMTPIFEGAALRKGWGDAERQLMTPELSGVCAMPANLGEMGRNGQVLSVQADVTRGSRAGHRCGQHTGKGCSFPGRIRP